MQVTIDEPKANRFFFSPNSGRKNIDNDLYMSQ